MSAIKTSVVSIRATIALAGSITPALIMSPNSLLSLRESEVLFLELVYGQSGEAPEQQRLDLIGPHKVQDRLV